MANTCYGYITVKCENDYMRDEIIQNFGFKPSDIGKEYVKYHKGLLEISTSFRWSIRESDIEPISSKYPNAVFCIELHEPCGGWGGYNVIQNGRDLLYMRWNLLSDFNQVPEHLGLDIDYVKKQTNKVINSCKMRKVPEDPNDYPPPNMVEQ